MDVYMHLYSGGLSVYIPPCVHACHECTNLVLVQDDKFEPCRGLKCFKNSKNQLQGYIVGEGYITREGESC